MNAFSQRFKEVCYSVSPITLIVIIMKFIPGVIPTPMFGRFIVAAFAVVLGLSIFLLGVDISISPLGEHIGAALSKAKKVTFVVVLCLIIGGFVINIAEPDLQILASQVSHVTSGIISSFELLSVVSIGIAIMLTVGFIRIVYSVPLYIVLICSYSFILILSLFVPKDFLGVAFDSSGATTGALTVPFLLALTLGISSLQKDVKASEKDSFGLVAVASSGAIMAVLIMGIFRNVDELTGTLPTTVHNTNSSLPFIPFFQTLPAALLESLIALSPICVIFIIFQITVFHLNKRSFIRILKGLLYTLIGLSIFLAGVNTGFMEVGAALGLWIASSSQPLLAAGFGLLLGIFTVMAEPAVHVLTLQIEEVTAGYINRKFVIAALSLGVGLAVLLSIIRILVPSISLWHYLLPGYIIALTLSFFAPKLFVGIGFDSGGVASGPMTATFILSFTQGVAENTPSADVFKDAFGMIAMVAMMPILTIEVLGLLYKIKTRNKPTISEKGGA